jgi:hypothetical protein
LSSQIIWVEGLVRLSTLGRLAIGSETHDVRDDIVSPDCCTLGLHPQSNLDVWLGLFVWVVFWVLSQSLLVSKRGSTVPVKGRTLKMINSSIGIEPVRTVSPSVVR